MDLTFDSSQTRNCVSIMLRSDNILERTEQFWVVLTSAEDQPVLLDVDRATVALLDTTSEFLHVFKFGL